MEFPPEKKFKHSSDDLEYEMSEELGGDSEDSTHLFFKDKVQSILQKLVLENKETGEFVISGKLLDAPTVVLSIKNTSCGRIRFPFYEDEADEITEAFEQFQPSYGKGIKAFFKTTMRSSWKLDPQAFEILNPEWDKYIQTTLLPRIYKEMSLEFPLSSSLYKLLMHKTGSFSKPSRDSEKEDKTFGTLIIQLPSKYKGGQFKVTHDGRTKIIDFSSSSSAPTKEFSTNYWAFYDNCQYEVLPVTEGLRLCLVYNLLSKNTYYLPVAPPRNPLEIELQALFQKWNSPELLAFALRHKYPVINQSFSNLKKTDKALASILKYMAEEHKILDVALATLTKSSTGHKGSRFQRRRGHFNYDETNVNSEDLDYCERTYKLMYLTLVSPREEFLIYRLKVNLEDEIIPEDCFDSMEPYKNSSSNTITNYFTGDARFDARKHYRRTAIVFWPRKYALNVLESKGAHGVVLTKIFLRQAKEYREKKTEEMKNILLDDARTIFPLINTGYISQYDRTPLLTSLIELKDLDLIQNYCHTLTMSHEILPLIIDQCEHFGWKTFTQQLVTMFKKSKSRPKDDIELLDLMIKEKSLNEEKRQVFLPVMSTILEKFKDFYWPSTAEAERRNILNTQEEVVKSIVRVAQTINFNMIELLKTLFQKFIVINEKMLPWVVKECDKYGWKSFATQISFMFERVTNISDSAELLTLFIGKDNWEVSVLDEDKKEVCRRVLTAICHKITKGIKEDNSVSRKVALQEADEKLLHSLWSSARKIDFDTEKLLQAFHHLIIISQRMLPWIINECNQHGWILFSLELPRMFQKIAGVAEAVELFEILVGNNALEMRDDKKKVCSKILSVICSKMQEEKSFFFVFSKPTTQESDEKLLHSLCVSAHKINFNMMEFMKNISLHVAVPVLILLANSTSQKNVLEGQWANIAKYFVTQMEKILKERVVPDWRINIPATCKCKDCAALDTFLKSDSQSQTFKMGKERRKHLQQKMDSLEGIGIVHETDVDSDAGRAVGTLVVTKTVKNGQEKIIKRNSAVEFLPKLCAFLPQ